VSLGRFERAPVQNSLRTNPWIVRLSTLPNARVRLFCFPYGGAGSLAFRDWTRAFPSSVELAAVQLPGRENRFTEPAISDWPPLVNALANAIVPVLDRPFAFYGHSLGTLVAFELALELRRRGGPLPFHLIVSGRGAPHRPPSRRRSLDLSDDELVAELRMLGGTPEEVFEYPELLETLLPTIRADFRLHTTYAVSDERPLDVPVTAYGGLDDAEAAEEDLGAWRDLTGGPFRVRMFPGGHFFLNTARDPFLRALVEDLTATMP
jgi:medium-chain acyl-[acyl-carrier-protein] hydrolase